MIEPPYECQLCRMEMANRLLDCADGDITASVATFLLAMNSLALKYQVDLITLVREIMIDIHKSHGGDDEPR